MPSIEFLKTAPWLLPVLIGVALAAVAIAVVSWSRQRQQQAWAELAMRTGLEVVPGGWLRSPAVTGMHRRRRLTLDTYTVHHGKSSTTYTRIVLALDRPAGLTLTLYDEGVFSRLGKLLGAQDIQTGDEELDRRFVIKGTPELAVTGVLRNGGLRQKLLQARPLHVELKDQTLRYQQVGVETNVDYLQSLLDLLGDLADVVDRAGGARTAG